MTDTATTFPIIDGGGNTLNVNARQTATATITPMSVPQVNGDEVSGSNPLPIATFAASYTNRSGSIATGGVAQQLMAANASRRGWMVQNTSGQNLYVNETGVAAVQGTPSWTILPNSWFPATYYNAAPSGAISIIGPTTGQTFIAREW